VCIADAVIYVGQRYSTGEQQNALLRLGVLPRHGEPRGVGAKGRKMHVIGMQEAFEDIATDPRISGDTLVIVNAILDPATFSGPMWGTFELVNADGAWTGQWVGNLDNFASSLQATAHGSGAYEGLVANVHYNRRDPGRVSLWMDIS